MAVGMDAGGEFMMVLRARDEATRTLEEFAKGAGTSLDAAAKNVETKSEQLAGGLTRVGEAAEESGEKGLLASVAWGKVGLAAGAAAAAVGALAVGAFKSGANTADRLGKLAERTQVSTEALSVLGLMADKANVPIERLAISIGQMERALYKAAENPKDKLNAALAQLGLTSAELVRLQPEQAMLRLVDALERIEDPFLRAEAGQRIFGRSYQDMLLTLQGGSQAFADNEAKARAWGIVVTSSAASSAEAFNDSLTELTKRLSGIGLQLTDKLAGPLAKTVGVFAEAIDKSGLLKAAMEGLLLTMRLIGTGAVAVGAIFSGLGTTIGGVAAALMAALSKDFKGATDIMRALKDELATMSKDTQRLMSELWGLSQQAPAGKARKMSLSEDGAGGFLKTAGGYGGLHTYSDMLPGAAAVEDGAAAAESALDGHFVRVQEMTRRQHLVLRQIDTDARGIRFAIGQKYDQMSLDSASFFFGQLGGLMQTKNRQMFEVGKAGAIGETVINTYRAAMGAYAALAGIPIVGPALGAAAAAAAVAVGMARVQAIRATPFGGAAGSPVLSSGGAFGPVSSGGTAVVPYPSTPAAPQEAAPQRVVNVYLSGEGSPTQSYIRDTLIPALNEVLGDGVTLNVRAA